jgi:hypothetical protein
MSKSALDTNGAQLAAQFKALSAEDKISFWRLTVRNAACARLIIDQLDANERRRFFEESGAVLPLVDGLITAIFELLVESTKGPIVPRTSENLETLIRERFGLGRMKVHQRLMENWDRAETAIRKERDQERVKPRKNEREFIVHWLRTEKQIAKWESIRSYLKEHHPELVKHGGHVVEKKTLRNDYSAWRKNLDQAEYEKWRPTYKPATH